MKQNYISPSIKYIEIHETLLSGSTEKMDYNSTPVDAGSSRAKKFSIFDVDVEDEEE